MTNKHEFVPSRVLGDKKCVTCGNTERNAIHATMNVTEAMTKVLKSMSELETVYASFPQSVKDEKTFKEWLHEMADAYQPMGAAR